MSFTDRVNEQILPKVMKFVNFRPVQAIKDGMLFIMPLSIVGSIFLLFAEFPWAPVKDFFVNMGWAPAMYQANNATIGIMGIVAVIAIAYSFVKSEGFEPLGAGISALVVYFLLLEWLIPAEGVEGGYVTGVPTNWLGASGVIAAILIGLFVGYTYTFLLKRDIRIKMPDSVPPGVSNSFSALLPMGVTTLVAAILYGFLNSQGTSFLDVIYNTLQVPLQGLSGSIGFAIVVPLTVHLLWWFGIHGATTVNGIIDPIMRANLADNANLFRDGQLTVENGAHIIAKNTDRFFQLGGSGNTVGLVVFLLIFAKSQQLKTLGPLAVGGSVFNINEPIIFGAPIVMNPLLFIPFVFVPLLTYLAFYFLANFGIVGPAIGIEIPWTTPPIIHGMLAGGWTWAVFEIFALIFSVAAYYPFMRKYDQQLLAEEQGLAGEEVADAIQEEDV